MYKVLDLFSGAGGMAEGFLRAGFSIPYASDISEQAKNTYVNRHNQLGYDVVFLNDDLHNIIVDKDTIEELKKQQFDVIIGGPPCQGFSNAGKRMQEDKRNQLVKCYLKMINLIKPKYFVMENVVGMDSFIFKEFVGISGKVYLDKKITDILLEEFDILGYDVNKSILDASDYGVPQKRRRIFFLGNKKGYASIKIPKKNDKKITAREALNDLITGDIDSDYQRESVRGRTNSSRKLTVPREKITNNEKSKHNKLTVERFKLIKKGQNFKTVFKFLSEEEREKYQTKKNNCRRLSPDTPAPTVVTLPDDYIHYQEDRILTVRELARLQSFDDSFEFLGKRTTGGLRRKVETPQYSLVGNAVPPLLAYAVACCVREAIENDR
ncbi:MAG: DNA cytosine methyltransferase [Anaerorhabdus sp.]